MTDTDPTTTTPAVVPDKVQVSLPMDKDLHARITAEADKRVMGKGLLIHRLIEWGFDHLPELP